MGVAVGRARPDTKGARDDHRGTGLIRAEPAGAVVLSFEWDALRRGDLVSVHDDEDIGGPLLRGVVAMVDRGDRGRGSTDIGVRTIELDDSSRVRRPARLATHLGTGDVSDSCWRCAAVRASV